MGKTNFYMAQKNQNSSLHDLSEIIVDSIKAEPFFNRAELIPKVKAILAGFKLNMGTSKYNKILNPSDSAKLIRRSEKIDLEVRYWKDIVKDLQSDKIDDYYRKRDEFLSAAGFDV